MRIAFYLDDGLVCGGAERIARALLRHWVEAGWEVHLISRHAAEADFYEHPPGVERHALMQNTGRPALARPRSTPLWLPGRSLLRFVFEALLLRRRLNIIAPDVAIAFLTPGNVKLLAAAVGLKCRTIVSERIDIRAHRYALMWHILRRLLYKRADLVTANIPAALDAMASYVPSRQLAYLPNPIVFPSPESLAVAEHSRRILFVGRLVPQKLPSLLIDAFSLLRTGASVGWCLDIVGDGSLREVLAGEIQQHGLQDYVVLHGNVHDIDYHYRKAAIFVLPSAYEGTPNALLEAMVHALPCIVSDSISCAKTLVADSGAGVLFSSDNAADLAEKLATLIADPAVRRAMGRSGREALANSPYATACAQWDAAVLGVAGLSRESPAT